MAVLDPAGIIRPPNCGKSANCESHLSNAGGDLFRFVLDPKIPPTNNAAERGLREIVMHRKIRGGIRAKETMTWMANFFSCVMTWKNKKLDYLAEIAKYA